MRGKKFYERGKAKYSVTKDGKVFGARKELKTIITTYATASDELSVSMNRKNDYGADMTSIVKVKDLVASSHLPNPNNWEFVKCKDGNRLNVVVSNLEWVATKAETYSKEEAAFAKARNTLKNRGYKTIVSRTDDNVLIAMNPQEHYLTSKKSGTLVSDEDLDASLPILPNGVGVHMTGAEVRIQGAERRKKEEEEREAKTRKKYEEKIERMKSSAKLITRNRIRMTSTLAKDATKPIAKSVDDITHPKGVTKRGVFGRKLHGRVPTMDAYGRPL